MQNFLEVAEIVLAALLCASILLQHRGTGIGGAFGGADLSYRSRRGVEQFLFRATILCAALFVVVLVAQILT